MKNNQLSVTSKVLRAVHGDLCSAAEAKHKQSLVCALSGDYHDAHSFKMQARALEEHAAKVEHSIRRLFQIRANKGTRN